MFESWIDNIAGYARERYPLRVFVRVAVTLTAAAFAGGLPERWLTVVLSIVAATILIFQFRLWDDLADRSYDIRRHPRRVLSRATRLAPFHALLLLTALTNFALLALLGRRYDTALLLNAAALVWYGAAPIRWRRSIAGRHLMLTKYPCFVWLIALKPANAAVYLAMGVVYLSCAIYELFHDDEIRSQAVARVLMTMEICILGGLAVLILRAFFRTVLLSVGASL